MKTKNLLLPILLVMISTTMLWAEIRLPKLVSNGMVLQRDLEIKIWGWASPGETIKLSFVQIEKQTTADSDGNWSLTLPAQAAGGPYNMRIAGENTLEVQDILIGDVWVCSGQSNMELNMDRASPLYQREIAESDHPEIRYFVVPKTYDFSGPREELNGGKWISAKPETIRQFSAVAYFFGLELYERYQVPIGLINSALGGSPAEAWISEEALQAFPNYLQEGNQFKDQALIDSIESADRKRAANWYGLLNFMDTGFRLIGKTWAHPEIETKYWSEIEVPGHWADADLGPVNGSVWFRRTFEIEEKEAGKAAYLLMGRIVDADSVFINGTFVGNTTYQHPPRRYQVPEGVLHAGTNVITVRIVNSSGRGGFVPDKAYTLTVEGREIELEGTWQYRLGAQMPPLARQTFIRWKPFGLYNAMISPILNYRIKGVIWYQGESNAGRPGDYTQLFETLIADWRAKWKQGDFPFLFVQLANFMEARQEPAPSNWAMLRDAQLKTLAVPNTGMAVAIDIGEWNDIHPLNKKEVGRRLALAVGPVAYGARKSVYSGPLLKSYRRKGNKMILKFEHTGKGLTAGNAQKLGHFAIAGADRQFVWAEARIKGNKVILWNSEVLVPVAVRYGWADNPEGANLYNLDGLPASPFRTDDWEE